MNIKKYTLVITGVLYVVAAALVFVRPTSPQNRSAQPKITWSQSSINVTLSPGYSETVEVIFSSNLPLNNIVIKPVPQIAPYLIIEPTSIVNVAANSAQSIRVLFSIPIEASIGSYEGTIHLQSGRQTFPQTLKVQLHIVWPQVTIPSIGITFSYPPQFFLYNPNPKVGEMVTLSDYASDHEGGGFDIPFGCFIQFAALENPDYLPLNNWIPKYSRSDGFDSAITVGGLSGIRKTYVDEITENTAVFVFIEDQNIVYVYSAQGASCISILDLILDSVFFF